MIHWACVDRISPPVAQRRGLLLLTLVIALNAWGGEPNTPDRYGELPLSHALDQGWGAVEALLERGADPNRLGGYRIPLEWSPTGAPFHPRMALIHWCAAACPSEHLESLLRRGADPALADGDGHDPLWYALLGRRPDNLDRLLMRLTEQEGRVGLARYLDQGGHLGLAATLGEEQAVERLLAAGADPGSPAYRGRPPFLALLENWPTEEDARPAYRDIARRLLSAGEPFSRSQPQAALDLALALHDESLVMMLLDQGIRPGANNLAHLVGDMEWERGTQIRLFERLLALGAPLTGTGWNGGNLLSIAAESSPHLIPRLLALGLEVNQRDHSGNTPLMYAATNGHRNAPYLPLLLEAGADPSLVNDEGLDALMFAALRGHAEAARLLLAAGADPSRRNRHGYTALDLARRTGFARYQDRAPTIAVLEAALKAQRAVLPAQPPPPSP